MDDAAGRAGGGHPQPPQARQRDTVHCDLPGGAAWSHVPPWPCHLGRLPSRPPWKRSTSVPGLDGTTHSREELHSRAGRTVARGARPRGARRPPVPNADHAAPASLWAADPPSACSRGTSRHCTPHCTPLTTPLTTQPSPFPLAPRPTPPVSTSRTTRFHHHRTTPVYCPLTTPLRRRRRPSASSWSTPLAGTSPR